MKTVEPVRVEVCDGAIVSQGWGRDEGDRWWVRFDDGRAYSVPRAQIREVRP